MKHSNLLDNVVVKFIISVLANREQPLRSVSKRQKIQPLLLSGLLVLPLLFLAPITQASVGGGIGPKGFVSNGVGMSHGFAHRSVLLASGGISKEAAVKAAKSAFPGKTLQVEKINRKGKSVFKVKLLSANSRVQIVFVDAATGKITK